MFYYTDKNISSWGKRSLVRSQLESFEFFIVTKSFRSTVALGSTQPLTEMSTRNISLGVKADGA